MTRQENTMLSKGRILLVLVTWKCSFILCLRTTERVQYFCHPEVLMTQSQNMMLYKSFFNLIYVKYRGTLPSETVREKVKILHARSAQKIQFLSIYDATRKHYPLQRQYTFVHV